MDGQSVVRVFLKIKTGMAGINARVSFLGLESTVYITGCDFTEGIIPMVAVPYTGKSRELAERGSKLK